MQNFIFSRSRCFLRTRFSYAQDARKVEMISCLQYDGASFSFKPYSAFCRTRTLEDKNKGLLVERRVQIKKEIDAVKRKIEKLEKKIEDFEADNMPKDDFSKQTYLKWRDEVIALRNKENLLLAQTSASQQGPVIRDITKNGYQGVENPALAFPRDDIIDGLLQEIITSRAIIVHSPPASGKTSLLQMLETKLAGWRVKYVRLAIDQNPFDLLEYEGINIVTGFIEDQLKTSSTCIMLDDAQNAFGEKFASFWNTPLKNITLPKNIRFVIASTYLIGGKESPAEFDDFPRITPAQVLLNPVQSRNLVDFLKFKYQHFTSLVDLIVEECGGNIGALTIVDNYYKIEFYGRHSDLEEQQLLGDFISPAIHLRMKRLFGSETRLEKIKNNPRMIDLLYGESVNILDNDFVQDAKLKRYVKCGILSREVSSGLTKFSNAMSRRYFMYQTYPRTAVTNPKNVTDLVIGAISKLSARELAQSVANEFPKEAIFQHLMMSAVTSSLTATTHVYPENSNVIGTDNKIRGRVDFFINSNLRWGIELLIKGSELNEHRERFIGNGKYVDLRCNQYIIVDFREIAYGREVKPVVKENVITVFLRTGNYETAQCLLPDGNVQTILLSS